MATVVEDPILADARERKTYSVYIMASLSGTLYIGMTSKLSARVFERRFHRIEGFTDKYRVERLLYWESFDDRPSSHPPRKATQGPAKIEEDCAH